MTTAFTLDPRDADPERRAIRLLWRPRRCSLCGRDAVGSYTLDDLDATRVRACATHLFRLLLGDIAAVMDERYAATPGH